MVGLAEHNCIHDHLHRAEHAATVPLTYASAAAKSVVPPEKFGAPLGGCVDAFRCATHRGAGWHSASLSERRRWSALYGPPMRRRISRAAALIGPL